MAARPARSRGARRFRRRRARARRDPRERRGRSARDPRALLVLSPARRRSTSSRATPLTSWRREARASCARARSEHRVALPSRWYERASRVGLLGARKLDPLLAHIGTTMGVSVKRGSGAQQTDAARAGGVHDRRQLGRPACPSSSSKDTSSSTRASSTSTASSSRTAAPRWRWRSSSHAPRAWSSPAAVQSSRTRRARSRATKRTPSACAARARSPS